MEDVSFYPELIFSIIITIAWILTLINILKSEFQNGNTTKWIWFVSVFLTGPIAMMFYYFFGIKQKVKKKFKFIKSDNI